MIEIVWNRIRVYITYNMCFTDSDVVRKSFEFQLVRTIFWGDPVKFSAFLDSTYFTIENQSEFYFTTRDYILDLNVNIPQIFGGLFWSSPPNYAYRQGPRAKVL